MNLLRGLPVRTKLLIATLLPVLALVYYLGLTIQTEVRNKRLAEQAKKDVAAVAALSAVIHEVQKERSLTLSLLAGRTAERMDLLDQREATDKAVAAREKLLRQQGLTRTRHFLADSLPEVRARVDVQRTVGDDFYSSAKEKMLSEISDIFRSAENIWLRDRFDEFLLLIETKEFLAQLRSYLGAVISAGEFSENGYGEFAVLKGKHELSLARFTSITGSEVGSYFRSKYQGPFVSQAYAILDTVVKTPGSIGFLDYDAWWNAATSSINALKETEDFSMDLIRQKADDELTRSETILWANIAFALLLIGIVVFLVISTIRGIVISLTKIREAAGSMTRGDVNISLDLPDTRDEISDLAKSFNQMVQVTSTYSEIAETIGKGDYSPHIHVRGEADVLGQALTSMRDNLKRLHDENHKRNWLLTGINMLNEKLRGEKDIKQLSQEIIIQVCQYLGGKIGAIYLFENGRYILVGSYAFHNRKSNSNSFEPGQGLVGQAGLEKKAIIFNSVPDDYIKISSGLGDAAPKNILVFPFIYEGSVKGVIEIGAAHELSETELEFLELVGENLGIAFNTAESRTQMKELLEETQRQAEELESQQEELRQSNEQLHEKTELLERSEAELKTQQEELQQTNEELEEKANLLEEQKQKLENAKMDLENKARELEVTNKYKSEFLANMSHELRTPLNSILILSKLLAENKHKHLSEKEVEFANNVYNSGTDLLNLINEILDLSKVEAGKIELDIATVAVDDIRSDLESMFSEIAKNKSIDFNISFKREQNLRLTTDKQRLQQILRNLLSNAFKFTGKGGRVSLEMEKMPVKNHFHSHVLNTAPGVIAFSVSDTGIGIPLEKQGIIFEAFQQADGSTKRKYGGTGLGLSISRELASALGGELHVTSTEGAGSKFTLYMPENYSGSFMQAGEKVVEVRSVANKPPAAGLEKLPVPRSDVADDRHQIQPHDKVVLIMEDDIQFANILLDFIRQRQYKGVVATQGNIGLSYARLFKPDAILLDMKLPVLDGAEVLKHLKNDPDLRHIPVQVISGYDRRKEGLELGAFDFLRKPIEKDQLQAAFDRIEDFLNKKLKKLLVVEDNENQNKAIRELIGNGDVKSFPARSGQQAYEMLLADSYDCVIVDLGLPDMSGFELLEKIKAHETLKKVPVVVYTGRDLTRDEHTKLTRLANTVVLKTADSHERLLDETMLFLHRVESRLPKEKQTIIRKLHRTDEVLRDKKVLVVDDDIRNIYSLVNVLEEEGMICITAENGREAVRKLEQHTGVDIVLMDVMMPEMDGYEATREIRSRDPYKKLPIIALTAKAMKGDREKSLNAGMSDYIAKPVDTDQLLSLMRVWLYQ